MKKDARFLAALAVLHCVLSLAFVLRVPLRYAPDEGAHWDYVRHLVTERSLPVLGRATYEAHQPPLYYVLCMPAYLATRGISQDATVFACRIVSVLLGVANLLFIYLGAREVFRGDSFKSLATTAFCAVLPMNLYVHAAAGNDALAGLASSATLWWLLRRCSIGFDERSALIAGALAGAAMLCKMNALFLVGVAAIAAFAWARTKTQSMPYALRLAGITVLAALILSAPWLTRNTSLYGDPLAWQEFKKYFQNPSPDDMMTAFALSPIEYIGKVTILTACTFWGLFGDVNSALLRIHLFGRLQTEPVYGALIFMLLGFVGLCLAGWIKSAVLRGRDGAPDVNPATAVLLLTALFVSLEFVQFNMSYFQAQARYLHMALMPIAAALVGGIEQVVPTRGRWLFIVLFAVLLEIVALDLTVWQPVLLPGGKVVTQSLW